jgi:hypothetical protein
VEIQIVLSEFTRVVRFVVVLAGRELARLARPTRALAALRPALFEGCQGGPAGGALSTWT